MKGYGFTYEGDIVEAAKWLPYAHSRLEQLATIGAMIQSYKPTDEVTILVRTTPRHIHIITTGGLYLESGFYDLISSARCNVNTFKPAVLYYNTPINTYINSVENPTQCQLDTTTLEGESISSGYVSKSVGGRSLVNFATDACGNIYNSESKVFSSKSNEVIYMQKVTQDRIPSSFYSGKMRLYVQSIYGSERTDYRTRLGVNGLPEDYVLYVENDFELIYNYPNTHGIFTTDNYVYYLLSIGTSKISIYPLRISSSGESARKALLGLSEFPDTAFESRIEAYILSTAKIDSDNKFDIPINGAISVGGSPLGYGWKFSRSGKECRIVLHNEATDDGKLYSATELIINITESDGSFSARMTQGKQGQWSHNSYFVPWVPNYFDFTQYQMGAFNTSSDMNTGDCPLYGWYEGETYKRLDLTIEVSYRTDSASEPDIAIEPGCGDQDMYAASYENTGYNGSGAFSGLSELNIQVHNKSSLQERSYYWGGDVQNGGVVLVNGEGGTYYYDLCDTGSNIWNYLVSKGYYYTLDSAIAIDWDSDSDPNFSYGTSAITYTKQLLYDYTTRNAVSDSGKLSLIIPLSDAESCITVKKQTQSSALISKWTGRRHAGGITPSRVDIVNIKRTKTPDQTITILGVIESKQLSKMSEFAFSSSGTSVPGVPTDVGVGQVAINANTGHYFEEEDGFDIRSEVSTAAGVSWVDDYVWATFGSNLGGKSIVSRSSYNGASVVYHGEGDGENRNGYRSDNAVGWA